MPRAPFPWLPWTQYPRRPRVAWAAGCHPSNLVSGEPNVPLRPSLPTISLSTVLASLLILSFYPRFYFPLSFIFSSILSYCFRHSLYYSSLFPHKTPSLFSLYHSPHYIFPFSIFYIFPSFPSLLPLLFHNPFIILFLFVIPKTLLLLSPLYS